MTIKNMEPATKKAPSARKKRVIKKKNSPDKNTAGRARVKSAVHETAFAHTLRLDSVTAIDNAKALHEELGKIVDYDVSIDASAIEMIDTAIFQLLCAFVIKVTSNKHKVIWINPSDEFISRARTLGLSRTLGIA